MNSSGGLRVKGKWRCFLVPALSRSPWAVRQRLLLPAVLLAGAVASTSAAPAPVSPRGGKLAPRKNAPAVQADVLSPQTQPASPDMLLKKEESAKADALAAYAQGMIAENNADAENALQAYQKALGLDPGNTELALKIAFELTRRGEVTAGIEVLKDSIKAAPKAPLPYLYLSQLYAKYLKKPEIGLRYAQQALDLDAANFAAYLAVYELYVATGQQKKADGILERAANLQVDDPQFWAQLGEIYSHLLLKEDGTGTPENLKRLNTIYQKALLFSKDDPDILVKVADFYVSSQQIKEAIPLYLKVIGRKEKGGDDASTVPLASVQDKLAKSFRATNQRDEAIHVLQQLIKENPMRFETYELLAELFEEKEDLDSALGNYQQVLLLDRAHPINYMRVADLQLRLKKYDKGIETLTEARAKFPELPQITYSFAIALGQAKQNQKAVATFEEALHEAETAQPEMLDGRFYFAYGAAAEQAGLLEKAAELLKKSIDLDPSNAAQACNYLGYMWVERGEHLDEAGNLIKRALEIDPENPAYMDSLGWWFFKKGEPQKAVEHLQKAAAAIKPEDAVVYEHLGDAYSRLNNTAQALVFWQKAVSLDPDNKPSIAEKIENAKQKTARQQTPGAAPDAAPPRD